MVIHAKFRIMEIRMSNLYQRSNLGLIYRFVKLVVEVLKFYVANFIALNKIINYIGRT